MPDLIVSIKDVGEKKVTADQVVNPAGQGVVQFVVEGPANSSTVLCVNLSELICVELAPPAPAKPAAPAAPSPHDVKK